MEAKTPILFQYCLTVSVIWISIAETHISQKDENETNRWIEKRAERRDGMKMNAGQTGDTQPNERKKKSK